MIHSGRRKFLKHGLVAAGGLGLGLAAWSKLAMQGEAPRFHPGYGPLIPVRDETSGLPILKLPGGFRYHSVGWAGQRLADGFLSPPACDGMGVVSDDNGLVTLVRNHELRGSSGAIGNPDNAWDVTGGGTSTLKFDTRSGHLTDSLISLNGTLDNCAGGVTPWGTWLSCEEAPVTPELMHLGVPFRQKFWHLKHARKSHGYVFEVHPEGETDPQPIIDMGQFYHEAAAVDPESGFVYMTEDSSPYAGLYRYLPDIPGRLQAGGVLQMLKVAGRTELIHSVPGGTEMPVSWVDIPMPGQGHTPGTHDGAGVVTQGMAAGGTRFIGLEGCSHYMRSVYFTSKAGGEQDAGQVFRLSLDNDSLELVFESDGINGFSGPDNIIASPQGNLMICEDRLGLFLKGQRIGVLDGDGGLFSICQINPELDASYAGHHLADTAVVSEWSGVCFSADGKWMFANIYKPGITLAITGPWENGPV